MPSEPQITQVNFASPTPPFQTIQLVQQFLVTQNKDQSQDIDYTYLTWYCVTLSWFRKNYTGQGPFLKDLKIFIQSTVHAAVTGPQKITSSRFWNVCTKSQSKYSEGAKIKIP